MDKTGLVLEGGGMRGAFTAGVLHFLMENDLYFPYTVGVSAGACNGSSYISRQIDRNRMVNIDFVTHPDYISFKRLLRKRELFGMDFLFDTIPNKLAPFDFDTFNAAKEKFLIGTTDCMTGDPVYFEKSDYSKDILKLIRASSSIPFMAPEVEYEGQFLLDGGISDPIPILKSEKDGNKKNVVVLTRNKGYVKEAASFGWLMKRKYGKYEGLIRAMKNRHLLYNETISYLEEQEAKGNVLIIRPIEKIEVGRIERNPQKLAKLYAQGYEQAKKNQELLSSFM